MSTDNAVEHLDLLFVVENAGGLGEEQASLAQALPYLLAVLTTGDVDGDGDNEDAGDFEPVSSVQVGVVTSDMGMDVDGVPTCVRGLGDDGVLRADLVDNHGIELPGCTRRTPAFLQFGAEDVPGETALSCLAVVGTNGCGVEQPLEAMLKALSPSRATPEVPAGYRPPTFSSGAGHGDEANAGFLRAESTLAVVVVGEEDDCSTPDPTRFAFAESMPESATRARCLLPDEDALHPPSRYVEGLLSLRESPDQVVYLPVGGVPTSLVVDGEPDYGALLEDDRLQVRLDPTRPSGTQFSCNTPGRGVAYPPRRLLRVAEGLAARGARTAVQSVCQADFRPVLDALVEAITRPPAICP